MKKKLVLLCLTCMMTFTVSACAEKNSSNDEQGTQTETEMNTESQTDTADSEGTSTGSAILDAERVSEREDYVGFQDLDIDRYVTLNDYRNMKVTAYKPAADDESIKQYINSELLTGIVKDRAVENGDLVNIDYVGKKDGEAFQGGTASGQDLEIGSGTFIDGFEEGLIGVMPGETVDLNLTFPENYHAEELKGQAVVFTVTVNGIAYETDYDNVTPQEMKSLGLSYGSREELWEAARTAVEKNAEETFEAGKSGAILNQILNESTIKEIPEYFIEEQIQGYEIYMESMCQMYYGMDFAAYLESAQGETLEDFEAEIRADCETTVKHYMIMEALARAEELDVTDELVREHAERDVEGYDGYTVDTYLEEVGYTTYRMFVLQEKLVERLLDIIEVEPASEQ